MDEKRRDTTGSHSPAPTATSQKSGESPASEPPPPRRRGQKRKSNTHSLSSSAPPKRHAREKAAALAAAASAAFLPPIHNGPLTRARQLSDNNAALNAVKNDQASMAAMDEGRGEGRGGCEEVNLVLEKLKVIEGVIEDEFQKVRSRDKDVHVVPVSAGWFSWTNIHPLEKQALQSFFNGKSESRTPEIYMEIRNWIMKRFHADPSKNIELKDLSSLPVGDLDARQEVMEFLDHWGLINYHPFPPNDPNNDADPNTDADKGEKTDSLIEKLYQFENEQSYPQIAPRANTSSLAMPTGLFRDSAIAEELVKQEGPAVEYHCNSCSADCSRKRYHCQKQADFDLCSECYNNGKFGSGMSPSDFILMEPGEAGASGGKWTDQETLLLLEALELYKENWNEIAEHVATKTKAQCILHFLQMPIEDSFLDDDDMKDSIQDIAEPNSINTDLSVSKDNLEPSDVKTGKDNSEAATSESDKLNSEPLESKIGKDDAELPESKTDANATQPASALRETSNLVNAPDEKVTVDKDDDVVLKALKDAFDAVGSPLTAEDKLSFADVGNPVMALAAFLTRLVEPGVTTASARISLKSMSRSSAGSLLAARHCFFLEDPPDDVKDQTAPKSAATEGLDQNVNGECENNKEIDRNKENSANQSEEKSTPLHEATHLTDDQIQEKKDSASGGDPHLPSGMQDICAEKTEVVEKSEGAEKPGEEKLECAEKHAAKKVECAEKPDEENSNSVEKPVGEKSEVAEKPGEKKSHVGQKPGEEKSQVTEKLDDEKSHVAEKCDDEESQIAEKPDEDNSYITGKPDETSIEQAGLRVLSELQDPLQQNDELPNANDKEDSASKVKPSKSANESENVNAAGAAVECTEAPKDVDMVPSSVPSDKTEPQDKVLQDPVVGVASETGVDKMEVDKTTDPKSVDTTETKDDPNVAKLKRAAVATLSAAAVKAKLLANQEEDEIRQLATLLIEKQLRKLEIKLSFFTEMDSAILRVKEQLDRSRQKLFNERAQIIASRLGISASSRGLPSSLPMNRMPPGLLNSMLRPPMSMSAQKPPMSRPVMTSAPPTTNTSAAREVAGGDSTQHSAEEKPSAVGTN